MSLSHLNFIIHKTFCLSPRKMSALNKCTTAFPLLFISGNQFILAVTNRGWRMLEKPSCWLTKSKELWKPKNYNSHKMPVIQPYLSFLPFFCFMYWIYTWLRLEYTFLRDQVQVFLVLLIKFHQTQTNRYTVMLIFIYIFFLSRKV